MSDGMTYQSASELTRREKKRLKKETIMRLTDRRTGSMMIQNNHHMRKEFEAALKRGGAFTRTANETDVVLTMERRGLLRLNEQSGGILQRESCTHPPELRRRPYYLEKYLKRKRRHPEKPEKRVMYEVTRLWRDAQKVTDEELVETMRKMMSVFRESAKDTLWGLWIPNDSHITLAIRDAGGRKISDEMELSAVAHELDFHNGLRREWKVRKEWRDSAQEWIRRRKETEKGILYLFA
jgi:hypothetical protein